MCQFCDLLVVSKTILYLPGDLCQVDIPQNCNCKFYCIYTLMYIYIYLYMYVYIYIYMYMRVCVFQNQETSANFQDIWSLNQSQHHHHVLVPQVLPKWVSSTRGLFVETSSRWLLEIVFTCSSHTYGVVLKWGNP